MSLVPHEPTGREVVAMLCNSYKSSGRVVPRNHLATLGRHAKTLLEDGFEMDLVLAACEIALRRGCPQFLCFIADDLQRAKDGTRMTRRQYEKALQDEAEIGRWST